MSGFKAGSKEGIVYFTFDRDINEKEFGEFLGLLTKLLDRKKPFSFVVDARILSTPPVSAGLALVSWMRKNKPRIPGIITASAIVLSSEKVISLIKWAFTKQKPVSPNLITADMEEAFKFSKKHLVEHLKLVKDIKELEEENKES